MSLLDFATLLLQSPTLPLAAGLSLAVVVVNGWTDAPNAIATVVTSRALPFRRALFLSALCNLVGVWLFSALAPAVVNTVYDIADFGGDSQAALTALTAALAAIVLWSTAAWLFGIPTSESHALVAGVTGAAVALQGTWSAIHWWAWGKVLFGLVFSLGAGFLLGGIAARWLPKQGRYREGQIVGAAFMSLLHGAQDGQKFLGVFLLAVTLSRGGIRQAAQPAPFWLIGLVAAAMALGTLLGGRRIIDTVCRRMACLPQREGFAADLGGGICLLAATLMGIPLSTTHAKTAAVLGAGMAAGQETQPSVFRQMGLVWLLTFPVCFAVGYGAARLALLH